MTRLLEPRQRKMLLGEMFVSTLINSLVPAGIIWALGVTPPMSLAGDASLLGALVKATVLPILAMTPIITFLVRGRVRRGVAPPLTRAASRWLALVPRFMLLRMALFAVAGLLILLPIGLGMAASLPILPLDATDFAMFNILYGAMIGLAVTPFVVLAGLADTPKAAG